MADQQAYGHFGKFQLGDHQGRPYIILKKAPVKYYDENIEPEDKTKGDVLFICNGCDWIFIGWFIPAPDDEGLTESMAESIEEHI